MTKADQFAKLVKKLAKERERAEARKIKKRTTILLNLPAIRIPPIKP